MESEIVRFLNGLRPALLEHGPTMEFWIAYESAMFELIGIEDVLELKAHHKKAKTLHGTDWRTWFCALVEEVGELSSSLRGRHEHLPALELQQIASIAMNWLEERNLPICVARQEHSLPEEEE